MPKAKQNEIPANVLSAMQSLQIVGRSPGLIVAIERALQVAPVDLSVLVIGESGAGKEFFPQLIHRNSSRKHKNYIAVNCGAIPEGTIDSELFGHVRGSFTGAIGDHKGYFEEADGGTIFLDEVAELPLTTQARLLRVLESGEYLRVGSSEVRKSNVRIVAATNKDMPRAVREGKFREDLYYRLSTVQISIPPLRERGNDVWMLTRMFSHNFSDNHRMPPIEFTDDAKQALMAYRWPGNVRQLKNVIEQISLFESGKTVDRSVVQGYLPGAADDMMPVPAGEVSGYDYQIEREILFKTIFQLQNEIENIKATLAQGGSMAPAAREVHLSSEVSSLKRDAKDLLKLPTAAPVAHSHSAYEQSQPIAVDHSRNAMPAWEVREVTATPVDEHAAPAEDTRVKTLEDTERETITRALQRNCGRRKKTAEELNISERTLYRKIKEYGLEGRNS